jgi:TetR/AcrR family transcriptional regulator
MIRTAVPVSNRRSRKTAARRREILRGAAAAFREHGIQGAGMREIAEAADLSPANLYYYFASRDEILFFCQDDALDRMLAAVREARSRHDSHAERLRAVIEVQVLCMLQDLEGGAAHLEVDLLPKSLRARIVAKRDRYEREIRAIVRAGVRARELVDCDVALVTRAILGAVNWTARWYAPQGPKPPAAIARAFSDYLVRGLIR